MSRHEGVSCDSCMVGNFRGKRYKCLVCYDYDLCATCYEAGATNTRHTTAHPMQCILTRSDFDLYYGGEAVSVEQPQSFTCPLCGKMGFTEGTLQEHVSSCHTESSPYELVCPICAALPGGDPNLVTDDFAAHLMLEHRSPRDLDEPSSSRQVRRIPHPGRGVGATRTRRANMHFSSSGGLTSLSPSSRDSMDPIAELLSQLSGVRRSGGASPSSTTSQLQQLQMQLQLERQQAQVARQHLDRVPRRQAQVVGSSSSTGGSGVGQALSSTTGTVTFQAGGSADSGAVKSSNESSQFLLPRYVNPRLSEKELEENEIEQGYRSAFVCDLLMNALVDGLPMDNVSLSPAKTLPWQDCTTDDGEATSPILLSQKSETFESHTDSALLPSQTPIQEMSPPLSPSPSTPLTSHSKQTVGTGSSSTTTSKKNPVVATGSTNRMSTAASRATASAAPNSQSQVLREQQGSTTSGGNLRSSSSNANQQQQQQHPPPSQRLPTQGTGTVREIPVPQAVVTGRIPVRGATSPSSSTRRKMVRHVDGRNQSNDPTPPH